MQNTPLREIMVTKVVTAHARDPFSSVEKKLRIHKIRHLPVVDESGKLTGIITERDLNRTVSPRIAEDGSRYYDKIMLDSFILEHCMTPNPLALKPHSTLKDAVDIMATHKFGCIPIIMNDKTLVGIVTQIDILKFLSRWMKSSG